MIEKPAQRSFLHFPAACLMEENNDLCFGSGGEKNLLLLLFLLSPPHLLKRQTPRQAAHPFCAYCALQAELQPALSSFLAVWGGNQSFQCDVDR